MANNELGEIDNLLAARDILKNSIAKSKDIAFAIDQAGPRLEQINQRLPALEASIKTIAHKCCALVQINRCNVLHAVGPAFAVLTVLDAVHELQNSLLLSNDNDHDRDETHVSDLLAYLYKVKRLEDALKFLTHNCKLVIFWLEDAVSILLENKDEWYGLSNHLKKSIRILRDLQATEDDFHLNGGVLNSAFHKLEKEFKHLLTVNTTTNIYSTSPSTFPPDVAEKLKCILERLAANSRLQNCISIYVEVRTLNARTILQALDLDYLETSLSEFESVQSVESCIDQWRSHLEFAVKNVLELEYRLCNELFEDVGLDVSKDCFAQIALQCGLHGFIQFANTVSTKGKKEAIKLFKLMDIFATLDELRLDFNRLFGGKTCVEIQTQTRDLIKNVINGTCDIFWELPVQVELQRQSTPPSDGSVPRLVSFVTEYANQLLCDYYRPILTQVLEIHWSWNHDKQFEQQIVFEEVHKMVKALELNLEAWARTYKDYSLSYLFLMNNHWYLCNNLSGTKIGELMGDSWLRGHQECLEHYAAVFMRETWGTLPALLSEEGLVMLSSDGTISLGCGSVKKRLKDFTDALDDMYRKQSRWVVLDKGLRWKLNQVIVRAIVPVYSNFIHNYLMPLMEKEGASPVRPVKYSTEGLENMLCSIFQEKQLGKYGSSKCKRTHLIGKIKNVVTDHFSSTPAAA